MTITYLQAATSTTDSSSYTFSSQNFGTASADRYLILTVAARKVGASTTLTSVTIGGVAATIVKQQTNNATNTNVVGIAIASVPMGATGSVVVNFGAGMLRCGIALYSATGINISAFESLSSIATDPAASLDIPVNGFGIGVATTGQNVATTWSGLDEDYDTVIESNSAFTGASKTYLSGSTNQSILADFPSATESAGAFASWGAANKVILRPAGAGDNTNWPSITGGTDHHAVTSDSDIATYVRNNVASDIEDDYTLTASGLTNEVINSIDVRVVARGETTAAATLAIGLRLGGTNSMATTHTAVPISDTTYMDTAIARPGGGSWTVSDLATLQAVIIGNRSTSDGIRVYEVYVDVYYTPSNNITVTPATKSLILSTFAATVVASDNKLISPPAASLVTLMSTPTAQTPRVVNPSAVALSLATFNPAITTTDNIIVMPTTAGTTTINYMPSVTISDNKSAAPGQGSLTLSTATPVALLPKIAIPHVLSLSISTFDPLVLASANITASPVSGSLDLTGIAPSVSASNSKVVEPDQATLSVNRYLPTILVTANVRVEPENHTLSVSSSVPTIRLASIPSPIPATLVFSALSPIVIATDHKVVNPVTAALAISRFVPNIQISVRDTIPSYSISVRQREDSIVISQKEPDIVIEERPDVTTIGGNNNSVELKQHDNITTIGLRR